jgi:hypothetical protein
MIGKKGKFLALFLFLSVMVVALILIVNFPGWGLFHPIYDKKIHRIYSTPDEEHALNVAERVDYSKYWNISNGSESTNQYSGDWFLNKTKIDHYSSIIDKDKANKAQIKDHLDYTGKAYPKGHHEIVYDSSTGLKLDNGSATALTSYSTFIHAADRTIPKYNARPYSPLNLTSFNYSFDDCYVVTMNLKYSYYISSKGAWSFDSFAVVVVDSNNNILFVLNDYSPGPHA